MMQPYDDAAFFLFDQYNAILQRYLLHDAFLQEKIMIMMCHLTMQSSFFSNCVNVPFKQRQVGK
jgi:hypothetical protein